MQYPKVYKISSSDKDIKINGIMIKTNKDLFLGLSLDKITTGFYKKELYSKLDNQLLGSTFDNSISVADYDLYHKYISKDNSYYVRIYHSNDPNDYVDVDLKLKLGYKNDLAKNIPKYKETLLDKSNEFRNKIRLKMTEELNYYHYKENDIYYTYYVEDNEFVIDDYSNKGEVNQYFYDFETLSLVYFNRVNDEIKYTITYYDGGNSCLENCDNVQEKLDIFYKLVDNLLKS